MFTVGHPVTRNGEMEATNDVALGQVVKVSGDNEVDVNTVIGDRSDGICCRAAAAGDKPVIAQGSGTVFTTDQVEAGITAGMELVAHTTGLLKEVVTPATDFIFAKCLSVDGTEVTCVIV